MYSFSAQSRSQSFSLRFVNADRSRLPLGFAPVSLLQSVDDAVAERGLELYVVAARSGVVRYKWFG